jgi:argininosuccinate lyase
MSSPKNSLANKSKAWSGRFAEPVDILVQRYTSSLSFDQRLALVDIAGSLAHAEMLAAQKIISKADFMAIQKGMAQIEKEIVAGRFDWQLALEDVHLNIEARLTKLIGDAGKRLHTGRSRNDQVATDIRLWLRSEIDLILGDLTRLREAFLNLAEQHASTIMPGHTHLQVAQPVTFGHHLLAYYEMFTRDSQRLADCRARVNQLPLGAAALAGTSYPIDRARVAKTLGFDGVCQNSLDAVSDRDFAIEFCASAAILMMHISRLSEELILWLSPRFGFIELARGKTGRVNGDLIALLTLMKGQPLAYNKDNQEDKEPLFDAVDTVSQTIQIFVDMVPHITVDKTAMEHAAEEGFATATDLADYLVKQGLPFRDAHEAVAHAVKRCVEKHCALSDLSLAELIKACGLSPKSKLITQEVFAVLTPKGSVNARNHVGGTAPKQVLTAIKRARTALKKK